MSELAKPPGGAVQAEAGWRCVVIERLEAADQMAVDERLAAEGRPTFRLFRWDQPGFSLGLRQPAPDWMHDAALAEHGLSMVRRPTGGGLAVHGSDLSCSVTVPQRLSPRLHELLVAVCETIAGGLHELDVPVACQGALAARHRVAYCLAERSPYALMVGSRKLGGFAARRYAESWLIQGSMLLRPIPAACRRVMPPTVREAFQRGAISLEDAADRPLSELMVMQLLQDAWRAAWPSAASVDEASHAV